MKLIDQIAFNTYRNGKLNEIILRIFGGTYEEQINKRMSVNHLTRREAEEEFDDFISNELFKPCPIVDAVDEKLLDNEE